MNKPSLTILMMLVLGSVGAAVWNFNHYRPYPVAQRGPGVRNLELSTKLANIKGTAPVRVRSVDKGLGD